MACSKIFSVELPELLSDIMQYFRNDFSTLHSCILINRLWCHLAIPLLWENLFSISIISRKNYYDIEYHKIRFIETYLINLNDNDKIKLNEFGINHLIIPSNTLLFNYPSFIQHLDARLIGDCIENWVAAVKYNKEQLLFLFIRRKTQNLDFIKFIHKILIKLFIENKANLYSFDITPHHKYFDIVSESVLQSPHFICNIKILNLKIRTPLLKVLSSNCNSISSLYISSFDKHNTDIEYLSQLIKSQKNLKKICFIKNFPPILLNSNCLNTLNTIIFRNVNFKNINILNEVFEQLNVLESVHIINCYSLDSNFIQQIINLTKPFKLKSLFIDKNHKILKSIELLLQKSGDYLENFGLSFENAYYEIASALQLLESKSQLLELITRYCTKIKFFELTEFNNQNIYLTFNLIENIKQNLNYLTIDMNYDFRSEFSDRDTELGSIILQNLGQILPFKLEYLDLTLVMNTTDFEIFLINSQDTFIKKLLFSNIIIDRTREEVGQDNMLYNIKDHVMKMKRVKYFAFQNHYFTDNGEYEEDLFHLINEVKKFKLYNIVVQNYNDLKIRFIEFLKE